MRSTLLSLVCCVVVSAGDAISASSGFVLTLRGSAAVGPIGTVSTGLDAGGTVLPWADLAVVAMAVAPAIRVDGALVTSEGEVLRGLVTALDKGAFAFQGDLHGALSVPSAQVSAVVLAPLAIDQLSSLLTAPAGALLVNGERIAGKLMFINSEGVGIDTGRRTAQIPRARVAAVVVTAPVMAPNIWFHSLAGDRLLARSVVVGVEGLAITGPLGTASLPLAGVAGITNDARTVPLERSNARRAAASDLLGAELPLPDGGFPGLYGGLAAQRGLVLPARGDIVFANPGATSLVGWAAAPALGADAVARIVCDGKTVWEHTLKTGGAAVPFALPVQGVGEIVLVCDDLAGARARCTVAWCHPTLVK